MASGKGGPNGEDRFSSVNGSNASQEVYIESSKVSYYVYSREFL